jgi:hypothetical protein
MKDIMQKLAELEATAPKATKKKMLNEDSTTPPMNVSNKPASLKDVFAALSENIDPNQKPLSIFDPRNQKAGLGVVTSKNPTVQNMLKNLDPNDVQVVMTQQQPMSGQQQQTGQQQQQQTGQSGQPAPAGATGQPQQGQMQMREKEATGQKYEARFANGKTQRFVAASVEEAKKKAKGLGAKSLIKVTKDGMPKGKVEEKQLDELSPELITRARDKRYDQLSSQAAASTGTLKSYEKPSGATVNKYWDTEARNTKERMAGKGMSMPNTSGAGTHPMMGYNAGKASPAAKTSYPQGSEMDQGAQYLDKIARNKQRDLARGKMMGVAGKKLAGTANVPAKPVAEGAKVDRMVNHIEQSERGLGKSKDEAEDIAWATANKRGMLDNKNKKKVKEGDIAPTNGIDTRGAGLGAGRDPIQLEGIDPAQKEKEVNKIIKKLERAGASSVHKPDALRRVAEFIFSKMVQGLSYNQALVLSHKISEGKKPDKNNNGIPDYAEDGKGPNDLKKKKKKVVESMNDKRIRAARHEGKGDGLRGEKNRFRTYEDLDEARAYHEGYKDGLDELHEMGMYETAPAATVPGMADDAMEEGIRDNLKKAGMAAALGATALGAGGMAKGAYDYHKKNEIGMSQADFGPSKGPKSIADMMREDDMEEGNAFGAAVARTRKGDTFSVGGRTYTDRTNYDANVNEYAVESGGATDALSRASIRWVPGDREHNKVVRFLNRIRPFKNSGDIVSKESDRDTTIYSAYTPEAAEALDQAYYEYTEEFRAIAKAEDERAAALAKKPTGILGRIKSAVGLGENDFAFEAWDRELNNLLNEGTEVNEGLSVSISKGQQNSPDSVTITAQDAEAEHLLAFVKNAGLGLFGDDHDHSPSSAMSIQPAHGAPDEVGAGGVDVEVVDGHDGMMGLMQKLSGIQSAGGDDYEDEDGGEEQLYGNHQAADKKDCGCDGDCECSDYDKPSNEQACMECGGMMEAGHSCGSKMDEEQTRDQLEADSVSEDNAPDSETAETTADEYAGAKQDAALAGADSGDEEEMNESFASLLDRLTKLAEGSGDEPKHPKHHKKDEKDYDDREDDTEQLDEISDKLAQNYASKASDEMNKDRAKGIMPTKDRSKGVSLAMQKSGAGQKGVNPSHFGVKVGTTQNESKESTEEKDKKAEKAGKKVTKDIEYDDKKEKIDEWANDAGKKGTDASFEQDIDFMTRVISGGLNKPKSTGQTTVPVIAGQTDRMSTPKETVTESVSDWVKLAGIK